LNWPHLVEVRVKRYLVDIIQRAPARHHALITALQKTTQILPVLESSDQKKKGMVTFSVARIN